MHMCACKINGADSSWPRSLSCLCCLYHYTIALPVGSLAFRLCQDFSLLVLLCSLYVLLLKNIFKVNTYNSYMSGTSYYQSYIVTHAKISITQRAPSASQGSKKRTINKSKKASPQMHLVISWAPTWPAIPCLALRPPKFTFALYALLERDYTIINKRHGFFSKFVLLP